MRQKKSIGLKPPAPRRGDIWFADLGDHMKDTVLEAIRMGASVNIDSNTGNMVVMVGVLLCISMTLLPPKPRALLLAAYVVFIFYETLMFRESGDQRTALIPFSYLKQFALEYTVRAEVIDNTMVTFFC